MGVDVHLAPALVPADLRHLDAMMAVMHAAFDPQYGEAWSAAQLAGTLSMPGTWARLALFGTIATGFTLSRSIGPDVELLLIAVDPAQRRLGVGARLLQQSLADASARGALDVLLEVREDNVAARQLYARAGFIEVGRRADYYSGKDGSKRAALTLRLSLHQ